MIHFQNNLKKRIEKEGPLPFEDVFALSNRFYYANHTPFGKEGDFITAPEISQMFGECLALFMITFFEKIKTPFHLVEMGPGQGSLMKDVLRVLQKFNVPVLDVYMVEQSPSLKKIQQDTLKHVTIPITWVDTLDDVPKEFSIFMGNEFLDALGLTQYSIKKGDVFKKHITSNSDDFIVVDIPYTGIVPPRVQQIMDLNPQRDRYDIEYSDPSFQTIAHLSHHIQKYGGMMIMIDYGDDVENRVGDTLQAVKKHAYVDVLKNLGHGDLTYHIDFYGLKTMFPSSKVLSQRDFLLTYGIKERLHQLILKNPYEKDDLMAQVDRLIHPRLMGDLFKVFVGTL